jgi:hypothetical protein
LVEGFAATERGIERPAGLVDRVIAQPVLQPASADPQVRRGFIDGEYVRHFPMTFTVRLPYSFCKVGQARHIKRSIFAISS